MREAFDLGDRKISFLHLYNTGREGIDPLDLHRTNGDNLFAPNMAAIQRQARALFQGRRPDGTAFRVYPAFILTPQPNALAVDLGPVHFCGVHTGLATLCDDLARFMFCQKTTFPEIGDPAKETAPSLPEGLRPVYRMNALQHGFDVLRIKTGGGFVPEDETRRIYAHFLCHLMLRFAWLHEIFHCLCGHTGFLAAAQSGLELYEMPDDGLALFEMERPLVEDMPMQRILHCFEYDADRAALYAMIRHQQEGSEPLESLGVLPLSLRLRLVYLACLLMVFLFDQGLRWRTGRTGEAHPEPQLRLHNLLRTIETNMHEERLSSQAFSMALDDMDRLCPQLTGLVSSEQIRADFQSSVIRTQLDNAEEDLFRLRTRLQPYAYSLPG